MGPANGEGVMIDGVWKPIIWKEDMSVGVAQLDDDHKGLISILNRLGEALHEEGETRAATALGFRALSQYMRMHFAREEHAMRAADYPGLAGHHPQHVDFIEEMTDMAARFEAGSDEDLLEDLVLYLRDWLITHIMVEDMAYKPFLCGNSAAHRAAREYSAAGR